MKRDLKYWQNATNPEECTSKTGDVWTGDVELDGQTLWFAYKDSNGMVYQSQEKPARRIDLRHLCYVCIPESKAHLGLPK